MGVEGQVLSELVAKYPRMLMASKEKVMKSFRLSEDLGFKPGSKKFVFAVHGTFDLAKETLEERLQCLSNLGFSKK